jgi:tetratricopeptide (TPR) repeat protein
MAVSPVRPTRGDDALDRAELALRAGQLAQAERAAFAALKANWADVRAARLLGQALMLQNRPGDAVAPLTRAARRTADPMTETLLAKALAGLGQTDEAAATLRAATLRRPVFPLAFLELGEQLRAAGRFDEAQRVLEEGLALAPAAHVLSVALAHVCLGRNDRVRARSLFGAVRAAEPQRLDAVLGLAGALVLDGDYAGAAALYRLALQARPDDAEARISLARCLLELGERDAGEATLRAATRGGAHNAAAAINALSSVGHGRAFLRPSAALRFLAGAPRGSDAEPAAVDPALATDVP